MRRPHEIGSLSSEQACSPPRPYDKSCIKVISLETGNPVKSISVQHLGNAGAILHGISQTLTCQAEGPCVLERSQSPVGFCVALHLAADGQQVWQTFPDRTSTGLSDWRLSIRNTVAGLQPVLERDQDGLHVHLGSVVGSLQGQGQQGQGWFAVASWMPGNKIEVTILSSLGHHIGRPQAL